MFKILSDNIHKFGAFDKHTLEELQEIPENIYAINVREYFPLKNESRIDNNP